MSSSKTNGRPSRAGYSSASTAEPADVGMDMPVGDTRVEDATCNNRCAHMVKTSKFAKVALVMAVAVIATVATATWLGVGGRHPGAAVAGGDDTSVVDDNGEECLEIPERFEMVQQNMYGGVASMLQELAICGPDQPAAITDALDEWKYNERLWGLDIADTSSLAKFSSDLFEWAKAAMPCACQPGDEPTPNQCGRAPAVVAALEETAKASMKAWYTHVASELHENQTPPDMMDQWQCLQELVHGAALAKKEPTQAHPFNEKMLECEDFFWDVGTDINDLATA